MRFQTSPHAQRSPGWFAARCGRLTGSRAGAMLASVEYGEAVTRRLYRRQLVYERYTGIPERRAVTTAAMRRGFEREPDALRAYARETGVEVRRVGFLALTGALAGCSVDGVVGDVEGILEVKAPHSRTHLRYLQEGRLPPAHRAQVTHNLWVSGARWCDFVSYDDRCGVCPVCIVRVYAADLDLRAYEWRARVSRGGRRRAGVPDGALGSAEGGMSTKAGVRDLLTALVRDNPDKPQFQLLFDFIVADGVVDEDRFAMVMMFASRHSAW